MATAIQVFRAQVDFLLSADDDIISREARDEMIMAAVSRYSNDSPKEITDEVAGDGGKYYAFGTSLSDWSEGASRIIEIEYPAATIADDETPTYLEADDWTDVWADLSGTSTHYLYLRTVTPTATETMRITYTTIYSWSGSPLATTTPDSDFFAICYLGAGLSCQSIAAQYAQIGDSTVNIDSASHSTKSAEFARRAQEFINLYLEHMGLLESAEMRDTPAGEFVDLDTTPGWRRGRRYLFHGNR